MRAFMSEPGTGPYYLNAPCLTDHIGRVREVVMSRDDEGAGMWAAYEAQQVLEHVEHETAPGQLVSIRRMWWLQHEGRAFDGMSYTRAAWHALTESLALVLPVLDEMEAQARHA